MKREGDGDLNTERLIIRGNIGLATYDPIPPEKHTAIAKRGRLENQIEELNIKLQYDKGWNDCRKEIIKRIESIKEKVREQTGSFKYDSCYDDIINLIEKDE